MRKGNKFITTATMDLPSGNQSRSTPDVGTGSVPVYLLSFLAALQLQQNTGPQLLGPQPIHYLLLHNMHTRLGNSFTQGVLEIRGT